MIGESAGNVRNAPPLPLGYLHAAAKATEATATEATEAATAAPRRIAGTRFACEVVYGGLGLLRLERLPLDCPVVGLTVKPGAGCRRSARPV